MYAVSFSYWQLSPKEQTEVLTHHLTLQLRHSIIEPSVYGIFTNAALLGTVANVIDKTSSIKVLVYDGPADDIKKGALEKIKAAHDGSIKVFTLDEFLALGKDHVHEPNLPQPEDLATIMYDPLCAEKNITANKMFCKRYTSGSTGDPKVRISRRVFMTFEIGTLTLPVNVTGCYAF